MKNTQELRSFRRKIGQNIRRFREEEKMELQELADHIHIHVNTLHEYEMGKRRITLDVIALIALCLNVPMKRLFE